MTVDDMARVRDIVADCEGAVAWRGDASWAGRGHFEIVLRPDDPRLQLVETKILSWTGTPGAGAGSRR